MQFNFKSLLFLPHTGQLLQEIWPLVLLVVTSCVPSLELGMHPVHHLRTGLAPLHLALWLLAHRTSILFLWWWQPPPHTSLQTQPEPAEKCMGHTHAVKLNYRVTVYNNIIAIHTGLIMMFACNDYTQITHFLLVKKGYSSFKAVAESMLLVIFSRLILNVSFRSLCIILCLLRRLLCSSTRALWFLSYATMSSSPEAQEPSSQCWATGDAWAAVTSFFSLLAVTSGSELRRRFLYLWLRYTFTDSCMYIIKYSIYTVKYCIHV